MKTQQMGGQAVVEALISIMVLALLWFAVSWLGRIQDLALDTAITARYGAFYAARQNSNANRALPNNKFITLQQTQWQDQRGGSLVHDYYYAPAITYSRGTQLQSSAQLGANNLSATILREQWHAADTGILNAQVSLQPKLAVQGYGFYPQIIKSVSIATGSAHSGSDAHTAQNLSASDYGWSDHADNSYRTGRTVSSAVSELDSSWGRALPLFDWLQSWASEVPDFAIHNN